MNSWEFDHVGHVVSDLAAAERFYCETMGFKVVEREIVPTQKVSVVFLEGSSGLLELIAPLPGNTNLEKFLKTRGQGLHHIAFRVPSVGVELERLRKTGAKLIDESPRPGSRGMEIAFLHPATSFGVLVELCGVPAALN